MQRLGCLYPSDPEPLELQIFAPDRADRLVELLTAVAHYHRTGGLLDLADSINSDAGSMLLRAIGLISLPYLDGPGLERLVIEDVEVQFL